MLIDSDSPLFVTVVFIAVALGAGVVLGFSFAEPSGFQIEDGDVVAVDSYEVAGQHQIEIYKSRNNSVRCLIANNSVYESGGLSGAKCWRGTALPGADNQ